MGRFAFRGPGVRESERTYDRRLGEFMASSKLELPHTKEEVWKDPSGPDRGKAYANRKYIYDKFQEAHPELDHARHRPKGI